jgi:DNA-binding transcriptional LysR family regulator
MPRNLLRSVTFRQLQVFEKVAKTGNFTTAAEELYLTQPTVSLQMKKLSEDLGVTLFEQVGRKVYLTEIGQALLRACENIFNDIAEFKETIDNIKGIKGGNLKLAGVTTTEYFAPLILGIFYQRYPDITVALKIVDRDTLFRRLDENQDDIYIVDQLPEQSDITAISFVLNPLVVVASPLHPLANKNNITIEDLSNDNFLLREQGSGTRYSLENFLKKTGVEIKSSMELGSNEALKRAVISGLGISVLSEHAIIDECANGSLTMLNVKGFPIQEHWHVIYPNGKKLSLLAEEFLKFALNEGKQYIEASITGIGAKLREPSPGRGRRKSKSK